MIDLASRKICFVIMPFAGTTSAHTTEYWNNHFDGFLKPLIEENEELQAHRSEAVRGDVLRRIITDLVTSPIVVADLTDNNPNVFWELGVRQSFKHGTLTILDPGDSPSMSLPFDVSVKGTLPYYPHDHIKLEDFRVRFKKALQDCLSNPTEPDSHVLETVSGRGSLYQIFRKDEILRRLDALISQLGMYPGLVTAIEEAARNNKLNPHKLTLATGRFELASLELLHTNRYLDADESLYTQVGLVLSMLNTCNEQVNTWESHSKSIDNWILNSFIAPGKFTHLTITQLILGLKKRVELERQRLATQP